MINPIFEQKLSVINIGLEQFKDELISQGITTAQLDWAPPARGNTALITALEKLTKPELAAKIKAANAEAIKRIVNSRPALIGFDQAINVVPGMTKKTILHAGPPVNWDNMCGAMQGAVTGALIFEGLAENLEQAAELAASGEIIFSPCHQHNCVGSMAGVTSASMFMHIVENKTYGNRAFTNLSEQMAKVLRMGANDQSVIERLNWMRDTLGPMLQEAMNIAKEIDLRLMLSQALHMGDECHNRNNAGTAILIQALTPFILQTSFTTEQKRQVFEFVASSDYFSGPTWMALAKCALDAAQNIEYCSIVTTMARNGYEFGIRISGMSEQWFTGPAQRVIGPMFAGYKAEDSGLDIGDSAITETYGIGGFAMATAPAIVALVGGTVDQAIGFSREMQEITTTSNPNITIPLLNFQGIASGIDIIKVVQKNILPVINTAIAHKDAGIGMIGAGIVNPPYECFDEALLAFAKKYA
ncbi:oxamate carbamoyltransferase subunit AllG family protein [Pasteurella testudinis]|uniref:oxamate carbamoyltransferase subunit AllG family protein n=1 Tax=Pasteurella testudinis TaxID=761 RepID=UPI004059FA4C